MRIINDQFHRIFNYRKYDMARMLPRYAQTGSDMINRRQYLNALKVELDLKNDASENFHLTIPFDFVDDLGCEWWSGGGRRGWGERGSRVGVKGSGVGQSGAG